MTDKITEPSEFDFHGPALDNIFETYEELAAKARSGAAKSTAGSGTS